MMQLAVIGLGKLGCPMAALFAAAGHDVVGADLSEKVVAAVNEGRAPVDETGLADLMTEASARLRATTSVEEAAEEAEVAFCIVPTPSLADDSFDTSGAESAFEAIGRGFARKDRGRRVAVLTSTVLPGATESRVKPALERGSGMTLGADLGLCYSPEFIALGSVLENMRHPDMVLMGSSQSWAAERAAHVIKTVADESVPVALMSIVEAEMTKISVNGFITTKISYANMIAEICERLPRADAAVVTAAVGLDSRIGQKYLRPGAPYGGPCFPRDNAAFRALASSLGVEADIAVATDRINRRQTRALVGRIIDQAGKIVKVAILGLTYKAFTSVAEEAFGVSLAQELLSEGLSVSAYDPRAIVELNGVHRTESAESCIAEADVVIVATPWPEFAEIEHVNSRLLFDYWRIIPDSALSPSTRVVYPGVGWSPADDGLSLP
jgi:UDPglucose 6-dehydrogenase